LSFRRSHRMRAHPRHVRLALAQGLRGPHQP
jgi:hypothetical protein